MATTISYEEVKREAERINITQYALRKQYHVLCAHFDGKVDIKTIEDVLKELNGRSG